MRFLSGIHESLIPPAARVRIQPANSADFPAAACRVSNWAGTNAPLVEVVSDGPALALLVNSAWCSGGALKFTTAGADVCPLTGATTFNVPAGVDACTPGAVTVGVTVTGPADQFWARGQTMNSIPAPTAVQNPALGYPVTWSVEPPLPDGVNLNPLTGVISGTPRFGSPATVRVLKATTKSGWGTATFTTTVQGAPNTVQVATVPAQTWTNGTPITNVTPAATDSDPALTSFTWTVSPALPAGVSLAASTGVISGTPTATSTVRPYVLTATDRTGASGSTTFNITVS